MNKNIIKKLLFSLAILSQFSFNTSLFCMEGPYSLDRYLAGEVEDGDIANHDEQDEKIVKVIGEKRSRNFTCDDSEDEDESVFKRAKADESGKTEDEEESSLQVMEPEKTKDSPIVPAFLPVPDYEKHYVVQVPADRIAVAKKLSPEVEPKISETTTEKFKKPEDAIIFLSFKKAPLPRYECAFCHKKYVSRYFCLKHIKAKHFR